MFFFYGKIDYQKSEYASWDLHDYRTMAHATPHLTQDVRQPFVYRVLGPYLAGLMPFSIDLNFLILSGLAGLALSCVFFLFLSTVLVPPRIAAVATILFILNKYLYGFPVWNYFHLNDILSQIEIVLLIWAMISQKWLWFGIVLLLGSLTRETPLILIPVVLLFALETKRFPTIWPRLVLLFLPALFCVIALRSGLHSHQGNNLVQAFIAYSDKIFMPDTWFRLFVNSFIPFSLVPLVFFKTTVNFFRERKFALLLSVLVVLSTFLGYNIERLMAPAFVIFYSLLAVIFQKHIADSGHIVFISFICAVLSNLHHTYALFPLPRGLTIGLSLLSLSLVTIIMIYHRKISPALWSRTGHQNSLSN